MPVCVRAMCMHLLVRSACACMHACMCLGNLGSGCYNEGLLHRLDGKCHQHSLIVATWTNYIVHCLSWHLAGSVVHRIDCHCASACLKSCLQTNASVLSQPSLQECTLPNWFINCCPCKFRRLVVRKVWIYSQLTIKQRLCLPLICSSQQRIR